MKFWGWGDGQDQPSLCLPWIPRLGPRRDEPLTASPCNKTISLKSKIAGRDRMDFGVCIVCHSHEQLLALAVVTCKAELQLALCWIVSAAFCMDNWGELRGNRSSRPLLCQKKNQERTFLCCWIAMVQEERLVFITSAGQNIKLQAFEAECSKTQVRWSALWETSISTHLVPFYSSVCSFLLFFLVWYLSVLDPGCFLYPDPVPCSTAWSVVGLRGEVCWKYPGEAESILRQALQHPESLYILTRWCSSLFPSQKTNEEPLTIHLFSLSL